MIILLCLAWSRARMIAMKIILEVHLLAIDLQNGLLPIPSEMDGWTIYVLPVKPQVFPFQFKIFDYAQKILVR